MKWLSQARTRRAEHGPARGAGMLQAAAALLAVCAGIVLAVAAAPAQAQEDAPPPSRVGRVAYLSGTVQAYAEDQGEWVQAVLNQPLTSRNSLWADEGAQAEVGIGSAAIQLDGATQADFSRIDDEGVAVNIARGSVALQLRQVGGGEGWTLNAGGAALHAVIPGRYALSYSPNTKLVVAKVFSGAARVSVGGSSVALAAGQQATLDTLAEDLRGQDVARRSSFDDWALARADAHERSASARHVSPEMTGADSLDRYGSWSTDPGYGAVWFPTVVVAGWAPYRYGHWSWMAPWGWTWIDDSPWGFAPFHYGRWARFGPRWGWVPGHRHDRPVYAPALVGFYGSGPGGVSGSVGWFPLAPGEIYRPPYWGRDDYVRRINRDRHGRELPVSELRKREKLPDFRYAHEPHAATVVPAPVFRARQAVERSTLPWSRLQMNNLRATTAVVPSAPGRAQPDRTPPREPSGNRLQEAGSERSLVAPRNERRWTPPAPANPATPAIAPDIRPHVVPERVVPEPARPDGGQRVLPRPASGLREAPAPAVPVVPAQPVHRAPPPQATEPAEVPRGWRSLPQQPSRQIEHRSLPAPAVPQNLPQSQPRPQPHVERQPEAPAPRVVPQMQPRPQPQPQPVAPPPAPRPQAMPPQAQPAPQAAPQPAIQRPQNPGQRGADGQGGRRLPGQRDDPR